MNATHLPDAQRGTADALCAQIMQKLHAVGLQQCLYPSDEFQSLPPGFVEEIQQDTEQLGQQPGYHAHADILLACVLAASGDAAQAQQLLMAILDNPKHFTADYALAHYNLFQLHLRQDDRTAALEHLQQAAKLDSDYTLWRTYQNRDTPELILGAGALGMTLRVTNRINEQRVLKILWTDDYSAAKHCHKQVKAMNQWADSRIPQWYGGDYLDPTKRRYPYWEMAYLHDALDGETWLTHCGTLSRKQGFAVGMQIAQLLEHAHGEAIYHYNIQPANLLLCDSDTSFDVVVLNFGLASLLEAWYPQLSQGADQATSEQAMRMSAALAYIAPELRSTAPESGEPGPWSDMYSLAVTLYRLITGRPPQPLEFTAIDDDQQRQLLQDCVQAEPEQRPSAAEFLAQWCLYAAAEGEPIAQYQLGMLYADGHGVTQDDEAAVPWLQRSAEQHYAPAQCQLGLMLAQGRGITQDATQALEWYRKAAEQGHSDAQYHLGLSYADSTGVVQDDVAAVHWYQQAAEQGHSAAQYRLGLMCVLGRGTPQDDGAAFEWCRQAAEQGYIPAQHNLGVMYARGRGVLQDDGTAVRWYRRAAAQGYAAAQNSLGSMYATGRGVIPNDVEAARWYRQAAAQGHNAAKKNLQRLRDRAQAQALTPSSATPTELPLIHGWTNEEVLLLQETTVQQLGLPALFQERFKWRLFRSINTPEMVVIPAGRFLMGSPEEELDRHDDECSHEVQIADPFALSRYPITFADYDYFCRATHHEQPADEGWGRDTRPVIYVSWHDAMAYCRWLSERTGQYYRLPTEAEWEYACRAGTATAFYYGDTLTPEQANYHLGQTSSVGQFPANVWGLHDMHGNVEEWVSSCYDREYGGEEQHHAEPDDRSPRAIRGGSWYTPLPALRSACRSSGYPDSRLPSLGFRIVRVL